MSEYRLLEIEKMARRDGFRLEVTNDGFIAWIPKGEHHYAAKHSRCKNIPLFISVDGERKTFCMRIEAK